MLNILLCIKVKGCAKSPINNLSVTAGYFSYRSKLKQYYAWFMHAISQKIEDYHVSAVIWRDSTS